MKAEDLITELFDVPPDAEVLIEGGTNQFRLVRGVVDSGRGTFVYLLSGAEVPGTEEG